MMKLMNGEIKSIVGAATIVGVLSFVSRIVGLVRDRILAGEFGAGHILDVYYAAFKLPDFMFSLLVVGALSASFIPIFVKNYGKVSQKKAWRFTNNVLHILGGLMILASVLISIFADGFASIVAPGFPLNKQADVAMFMRVMIFAQILLTGSMIFGSVLQSLRRFFLYSLAPIFYNFGIIIGALWFVDILGPIGLAWGVVFGASLHLISQVIGAMNLGYKYEPLLRFKDRDVKELLRLTGPRMLGIATSQLLFLILAILASTLAVGSVTIFQFAYNIQFFAVGIIGVSYAIAIFPALSKHAVKNEPEDFVDVLSSSIRQVIFLMVPLMILFLIMRAQIVRVVVGAGQFDWPATIATADTLAFFALTFIPQALVFLLARGYYALHDTVTPLTAAFVGAIVGIVSAFLFVKSFGVVGLGMAYSLSSSINALLLWVPIRQRLGTLKESEVLQMTLRVAAAGLIAATIMQFLKPIATSVLSLNTFFGVLGQGIFAGGFGLVAYVFCAKLFGVAEVDMLTSALKRKILRKAKPHETMSSSN